MLMPTKYGERHVFGAVNPNKAAILEAMRSFTPTGAVEGPVIDLMTGAVVDGLTHLGYRYENAAWTTEDVYNFEAHDLELNPEFCKAVLALADESDRNQRQAGSHM